MVSASAMLRVRQRIVFLIVWSTYTDDKDLARAKSALGTWANAIRAANPDKAS